jgi:hypothetical protein
MLKSAMTIRREVICVDRHRGDVLAAPKTELSGLSSRLLPSHGETTNAMEPFPVAGLGRNRSSVDGHGGGC